MSLEVGGLAVRYGAVEAIHNVDLEVRSGQVVALLGANGAGKTTTLRAISGLIPSGTVGSITFEGTDLRALAPHRHAALGIAHVPEGRRVFPRMSVQENLELGAWTRRHTVKESLVEVYATFPVLEERRGQEAGTLSGGEQQMLAIGRALMSRPTLLLLDEPSLGLSPLMVQQIFSIIARIQAEGTSILLVEQNAAQALTVADYAYVLDNGQVLLHGPARDVAADARVRRAYLGLDA